MNFKVDIEMTPNELRQVMGLPDVGSLQDEMIAKVREQMDAGAEGYDPLTLLKPYITNSVGSMESLQKLIFNMMQGYGKSDNNKS
ncbi:DUF6489 family protein [Neptunomonas japonica]|uniref:Uncharacterized protein n=1 Tax=Neptunomonas japonica JAMM 1380 TaxID=1441457 RepID=A0A7R6P9X9_9GAMM|nr:DUF6489 family protein [Neptunomonas japonica]BBB29959.1 conserved hypothetical protein [Neptunomonas japonica JAMM 1380]